MLWNHIVPLLTQDEPVDKESLETRELGVYQHWNESTHKSPEARGIAQCRHTYLRHLTLPYIQDLIMKEMAGCCWRM